MRKFKKIVIPKSDEVHHEHPSKAIAIIKTENAECLVFEGYSIAVHPHNDCMLYFSKDREVVYYDLDEDINLPVDFIFPSKELIEESKEIARQIREIRDKNG